VVLLVYSSAGFLSLASCGAGNCSVEPTDEVHLCTVRRCESETCNLSLTSFTSGAFLIIFSSLSILSRIS